MASKPFNISTLTLAAALGIVIAVEALAWWGLQWSSLPAMALLGTCRLIQTAGMIWVAVRIEGGLDKIGWAPDQWLAGLRKGALWSLGFALAAALAMALLYLGGKNPLALLRFRLPSRLSERVLFFTVGGLIAPLAEEVCFRGILYAYFRRWGVWAALAASTAIFVLLHFNRIPVTQIVGGLVFALAYETSRNLMVPITIHALGNLALFALSLPIFHT